MSSYRLLLGEVLELSLLTAEEMLYLRELSAAAEGGAEYFDLLQRVKGKGALPLRGGAITPVIAMSVLYRAAHDIVDRVGIKQGFLLAPDVDRSTVKPGDDLLSLTEAAEFIGISRPATHQALVESRLVGQRVGNAWVIRRAAAEEFKEARSHRQLSAAEAVGCLRGSPEPNVPAVRTATGRGRSSRG